MHSSLFRDTARGNFFAADALPLRHSHNLKALISDVKARSRNR